MSSKKIAVLGSGANGSSIGADLINAGLDVTLIEQWPEHVRAMRTNGLRVEMPEETLQLDVNVMNFCEVATLREQFDIVIVVMKAFDTKWAVQLIEPYVKANGLVAGVQNGMTVDTIAEVVGAHRTIGAVIEISSTLAAPGVVDRQSPPPRSWFAVGSIDPATAGREGEIADLLAHVGAVEIVENIRAAKWMKLVSNSSTLVPTAVVGLPLLEAVAVPSMRELMIRAGEESLAAGARLGYPLLPIFGMTPADLEDRAGFLDLMLDNLLAGFVLPKTISTILYDWAHSRHSEVDDVNGLVVDVHRRFGDRAPVNAAFVEIARRIERGELKPDPGNVSLVRELVAADIEPSPRLASS